MKKEVKNKVGRPKLTDAKTKKKAYSILISALILLVLGLFFGFYTLTSSINIDPSKLSGSASTGRLGECVKYKYDSSKLRYSCEKGKLVKTKCKSEFTGTYVGSCPSGTVIVGGTECPEGTVKGGSCFLCKKIVYLDAAASCTQGSLVNTKSGKSCKICDEYELEKAKTAGTTTTTTTKKPATTQKQLSISCYMNYGDNKLDVKTEGNAYVGKYVYCKTNQKGATWSIDGISSKDMKLYDYTVRFKYSDVKDKVNVKVSKSGYRANSTSFKVKNFCDAKVTSSNNKISISTDCSKNYSLKEVSVYNYYSNILEGINEYSSNYGKKTNDTIKLTKSKYVVKMQIIDKNNDTRTISKTVNVSGNYLLNTFNQSDEKRCAISNEKVENKVYSANINCGKNAIIEKMSLVNIKDNKTTNLDVSKYKTYGYSGSISQKLSDSSKDYKLRIYYKLKNNDKETYKMDTYIRTSERPLRLYCPSIVKTNDKFICYVKSMYNGVNIKIGNKTSNKRVVSITKKKAQTLNINATYGKQSASTKVQVTDNASKQKVHLSCSVHATSANKKFYCASTIEGVTIKISDNCGLNKGYSNTFTTSFSKNNFKYANYFSCSKKGTVKVTASKKGYLNNTYEIIIK